MISAVFNLENGIDDNLSELLVVFIPQLLKVDIFWIIRLKHFIDQRNEKVWHFLGDGSEDIVENSAMDFTGCFCSYIFGFPHVAYVTFLLVYIKKNWFNSLL